MGVRSRMLEWPVYRQLTGKDPLGRGAAARSRHGEQLTARTATADRVVESVRPYCAVPPALAAERRGLEHGGRATVVTARNAIEARVRVTERIRPLTVHGRGPGGVATGDAANELTAIVRNSSTRIREDKALTAGIRPGRRPRGRGLPRLVAGYRERAGITAHTGTEARS
ncbi:molybdopterin dinucleotide binding domain-containing protein [Streptomyces sp. MNU89]|uniref:molybdopterin dinucleotide binding domain-containing protein n=1 Tax=Streptomyces sp. MNU89 TaxID=2560025 RepID=UPI0027E18C4F|nr:molybdopterin dinucleotide binding domain-containing protein [Streptomyces sp. MNU89]